VTDQPFDFSRLEAPLWALDDLADYIVDHHHRYVQGAIPALRKLLAALAPRHPRADAVARLFDELADELEGHLAKEEHLLFPAIRTLARARRESKPQDAVFVTLLHPIRVMGTEHAQATSLLDLIRRQSDNYVPPADAGDAWRECYRQLAHFDEDLQKHIHLEDEILFPRALELERAPGVDSALSG